MRMINMLIFIISFKNLYCIVNVLIKYIFMKNYRFLKYLFIYIKKLRKLIVILFYNNFDIYIYIFNFVSIFRYKYKNIIFL